MLAIEFTDSSKVRVGDVVIENPLSFGGTVTTIVISSKVLDLRLSQDVLVDNFLQTGVAINTWNSVVLLYDM